jgi:hypothetical protein
MIWIDLAQLGFLYHMTYAGLCPNPNLHISTLTQILQNRNRSSATREHSTHFSALFVPDGFTGMCTRYSRYLSTPSARLSFPTKEYPRCWASQSMWLVLQGHDHMQAYNEWSLIDTDRTSTTRQTCPPQLTSAVSPGLNLNIITIIA